MTSKNMIEQIAKAIWQRRTGGIWEARKSWLGVGGDDCLDILEALEDAKIALEAMRTPTPKMLRAACAAMSRSKRPTQNHVGCKAKHGIRYRAMIDEALKSRD